MEVGKRKLSWETEEDNYLKENYLRETNEEMAKALGLTKNQVHNRMKVLGLTRIWKPEEEAFLMETYGKYPAQEIADALGRSLRTVTNRAFQLGVTEKRKVPKEGHKYCPRCKIEFPFKEFNVTRANKDGLGTYCSKCRSERYYEAKTRKEAKEVSKKELEIINKRIAETENIMKRCPRCKETKKGSEFPFRKDRLIRDGYCRECRAILANEKDLKRIVEGTLW